MASALKRFLTSSLVAPRANPSTAWGSAMAVELHESNRYQSIRCVRWFEEWDALTQDQTCTAK